MKKHDEKYDQIETYYNDEYIRLLSIVDHLRECTQKYDRYKNHTLENTPKEMLQWELYKELTDLFIILKLEHKNSLKYLEHSRLNKFINNIKSNKSIKNNPNFYINE